MHSGLSRYASHLANEKSARGTRVIRRRSLFRGTSPTGGLPERLAVLQPHFTGCGRALSDSPNATAIRSSGRRNGARALEPQEAAWQLKLFRSTRCGCAIRPAPSARCRGGFRRSWAVPKHRRPPLLFGARASPARSPPGKQKRTTLRFFLITHWTNDAARAVSEPLPLEDYDCNELRQEDTMTDA